MSSGRATGAAALALCMAILGPQPAPAQAPGHRVLPIVSVPADLPLDTARLAWQVRAVRDAQAWYADRLGGPSFYADPVLVQRSAHTFAELAGAAFQNWWPLPEAEFAGWGLPWNDSTRFKLLLLAQGAGAWAGADSENGGIPAEAEAGRAPNGGLGGLAVVGDSSIGGIVAGVCPTEGTATWQRPETGTAWWCNWNTYRGTVAHELGHTFGLPHPDAFRPGFRCDSLVITNMQCHWAWPADSLLPFEARHLRSLPFFGPDALAEWLPARPADMDGVARFEFERGGRLLWLTGRGGGSGYLQGVTVRAAGRVTFRAPAGTHAFVADVGLAAAPPAGTADVVLRAGGVETVLVFGPGDAPRTVTLAVPPDRVIEVRVRGTPGGEVGLGHPRWSTGPPR